MNHTFGKALRAVLAAAMMSLTGSHALAQEPSSSTSTGVVVNGNVFGGGNLAEVKGSVTVNIKAGTVEKDVYGGGALAHTNTANWDATKVGYVEATGLTAGLSPVKGLYKMSDNDYTQIEDDDAKAEADTKYYIKGAWANATDKSAVNITQVKLTGGTIGNVYGGGLGDAANPAYVWGNVLVDLNGTTTYDTDGKVETTPITTKGCIVTNVFGCNNVNGTPKGEVLVHVHATQSSAEGKTIVSAKTDKNTNTYDVEAVYGGGNQAEYYPLNAMSDDETTKASAHTNVIIDGCTQTSIKNVYGGGNAASTPSTSVTINGAYEINEVFGGGNGFGDGNPGANVGFHDYSAVESTYPTKTERQTTAFTSTYVYGSGKASVNIFGGTVHRVFGGSNTKGNVRITAITMLEDKNGCEFCMDEAYGGGKSAPMDAEAKLHMACIPGLRAAYGGAEAADVLGDVTLNITNGTFDRVFGGNNLSGTISGSITVNIEETGCKPIIIGELYGGGNQAAYSVFGYKKSGTTNVIRTSKDDGTAFYTPSTPYSSNQLFADPQVNVKSFTSIGKVYGGGLGTTATMVGNPTVNVNVAEGAHKTTVIGDNAKTYSDDNGKPVPSHESGKIGAINDVYGGGNAAEVVGNTIVNIGTDEYVFVTKEFAVGASVANYYIRTGAGTAANPYAYTSASGTATENTTYYERKNVVGADIRGNVYGGGEGAATTVTGDVKVNIGGESTSLDGTKLTIGGSVYGGSALGAVNATRGTSGLSYTEGKTTAVTLKKGNVSRYVFGGGQGDGTTTAHVYGKSTVTLYGDVVAGGLYGGCDANGEMHDGTQLDLFGGTVGQDSAPTADILFGGGLGQATTVDGNVTVNVGSKDYTGNTSVTIWGNVYGGGALGDVNMPKNTSDATIYTTLVNLYKGTVHGNVFGGGLGREAKAAVAAEYTAVENGTTLTSGKTYYTSATGTGNFVSNGTEVANGTNYFEMTKEPADAVSEVAAEVKGNVRVDLNGYDGIVTNTSDANYVATAFGSCIVTGNIFGCNNTKGSPKGNVEVHIYKTIGTGSNVRSTDKNNTTFDLTRVFGGGNKATYSASDKTAKVIIETCDVSIQEVYGGGFGADVPNTQVEVKGAYEIGTVFGGGYGASTTDFTNPGANVNGSTEVLLKGGVVHEVYGGSNTKGNIVVGSNVNVSDGSGCCALKVDNIYGGGKNANMSGGTSIVLGCQPDTWIEDIYAGSREADVDGNVKLTITSGRFKRVFGGNKTSGKLKGSITVNIEETGSCSTPIIIGELYAGGNEADYSIYGYKDNGDPMTADDLKDAIKAEYLAAHGSEISAADLETEFQARKKKAPQLNVLAFTSIGAIYGGGYSAEMYADPTVNINVVKGSHYNDDALAAGSTPALAGVTPATTLPYPAHAKGAIGAIGNVFGGGNLANVYGSSTVNIGTETTVGFVTEPAHYRPSTAPDTPLTKNSETGLYDITVEGANITGNVYGGGNQADVTGDTQVNICVKKNASNVYENVAPGTAGVSIGGDVFGAGKGVETDVTKALVEGNGIVKMGGGSVAKSVYGGGELSQVGGDTDITVSGGTIGTTGLGGAMYGNIYGGGFGTADATLTDYKLFGLIKGNTNVTISGGDILHNVYGGGAYGSVGEFTYDATTGIPTSRKANTTGGIANVTITGGTIGTTGKENGMVFGSSRGDVATPSTTDNIDPNDRLAWVYDTHVTIGTENATTGPQIYGSLYGSGENGHTWNDTEVIVYSGTIGVTTASEATNITEDGKTYSGAAYPYRGNIYGGGCGTDMYDTDNDNKGDTYNPLAGIVRGNTNITIDGGTVAHNIYGAGAMGSVGTITKDNAGVVTIASGTGTTTIAISGGTIGVNGTVGDGNVYGAARGDAAFTDKDLALVNTTSVTISGTTTTTQIKGNVYGGGEVGNVQTNTRVNIQGGAIAKNVFGGGKGVDNLFTCEQAMVGVEGEGAGQELDSDDNKDNGTIVTIGNGTVGTLSGGNLVEGTGNVYGGGEIGRVEWNTQVKIGVGTGEGTFAPTIYGNVFGAGKGLKTHGYSALVRGNSTVTVQGRAKIGENVYGGGEMSTVGRYWVKNINNIDSNGDPVPEAPDAPSDLPDGMPYQKQSGGICHVTIQGNAEIGTNGTDDKGHVFGAGKGVDLPYNASTSKKKIGNNDLVPFTDEIDEDSHEIIKTAEQLYYEFLQTLALVTESHVTIDESAQVKGSVFGGSESGFVQTNTDVKIQGSGCVIGTTTYGNIFGGGKGLEYFAEAGKVKGNTMVAISNGTVKGNVYGGGRLGDVGIIDKTDKKDDQLTYNYKWKQSDGVTANVAGNNTITGTNNNTGICNVTISGGTIGIDNPNDATKHGNVFGAGRGSSTTWWCEKAIAYATNVSVTKGTVYGNVYGGGEVGRVEDDAKVTIGALNGTDVFEIKGSVFGAGAGLATHGYSALVRGNAEVTVQGKAQVDGSVYGGGEIASVGRFHVVGGLPRNPQAGGTCTVKIQGEAKIGTDGTGHNVFGACKGVDPATINASDRKSMQTYGNRPKDAEGNYKQEGDGWGYYADNHDFIWVYYSEDDYPAFLKTLALTSNTHVTVGGSSNVFGSVYGGGERGITLGGVDVNMTGGTVHEDVYGGGSLADSNTAMWDATNNKLHDYVELELIPGLSHVTGYYKGDNHELVTDENAVAGEGEANSYSAIYKTNVNLTGGTIIGNAYGGGLGRKKYGTSGQAGYVSPIEAMVYGDVLVELNKGIAENEEAKGCAVTRVFGCNNLNGTPKGKVKVYVYATQKKGGTSILNTQRGTYDVEAVYGGGNLAAYIPYDATLDYNVTANQTKVDEAYTEVIIDGCKVTSIRQVYGGGNAAPVPASHVEIRRAYEIDEVFGGGNGADNYSLKEGNTDVWYQNPGANVGYYNYTNTTTSGSKPGSISSPYYLAPDDEAFDTKDERLADNTAAAALRYGSGIARLEVKGGTIHTSYGGSNSRGNIRVKASSVYSASFDDCPMSVEKSYGGGKNAPIDGEVDMVADCAKGIKQMFGGSENADVDNDINLVITNGSSLERVFGGNNTSGAINGSITVTIEEGGCEPIKIGHLYLGGFLAPYSVYGYEKNEDGSYKTESVDYVDTDGTTKSRLQRIPLESGSERKADPRIIVISATRIDSIFGGGYQAKLVGNPHVNVNMTNGFVKVTKTEKEATDGNTYAYEYTENGKTYIYKDAAGTVYSNEGLVSTTGDNTFIKPLEIGSIGTIYGGGNMADIVGDTYVEIGTGTCHNENGELVEIDRNAANITGNVFGGGKGKADSFKCMKAMVGVENSGSGSTNITIGNGTIEGTVYGGGEIGRVEANTNVTIGLAEDDVPAGLTSLPIIKGNVFGAGRGVHTHGYAALVRGNATVTVQGEAKVRKSVYGGGEIASVGKYNIADAAYHAQHPEVLEGMPYSLVSDNKGICYVTVKDNAVIGPEGSMEMKATGGPDDTGHVFGAGKGVLPYQDIDGKDITKNNTVDPWRMKPGDIVETFNETTFNDDYYKGLYGAGYDKKLYNYLADYLRFIETLALTTQTEVTVGGNAFVKGSVYGGSENGHVQHNTHVKIQDYCQIGHSKGVSTRFTEDEWRNEVADIKPCASWDYVANEGAPYDPLATSAGTYDYTNYQFVPVADRTSRPNSDGGKPIATDGHTFYGNVFGGGSGLIPYAPGKWHRNAGSVGGNTVVDISGGHIMTSVYGGNEQTDVGTYELDPDNGYQPTIPKDGGKCTINMTGGTVGVPRTKEQIEALPVICNVFGAGKGDQRIFFNTWTNVINTEVNISGTARIYGSTFGGGEDGHVMNNAVTNISGDNEKVIIGSVGTSYMDGNVFGGGRGFSGEAQTAGTVGGNVTLKISGGHVLGSVYGGGRLASVGTLFTAPEHPNYGNFQEDGGGKTYGHIDVEISGSAIIGNNIGNRESGNVFGGSMGRLELLNGTINPLWPRMAQVKTSTVTVKGDATIRRNVYGGGELGTVRDDAVVTISGGTVRRDVYGGGYGSEDFNTKTTIHVKEPKVENPDPTNPDDYKTVDYKFTPMIFAGCVGKSATVNVKGGWIRKSVYGGGEMASVGIIDCRVDADGKYLHFHEHSDAENGFVLSWPYHFEYTPGYGGAAQVNVTGGRIGVKDVPGEDNDDIASDNGDVYGAGKGIAGDYKTYIYCANVGSSEVNIKLNSDGVTPENYEADGNCITGAVYGGGENGHVMGDAILTIENGLIGHSIYGGGSGKGKFTKWLTKIPEARRTVVTNSGTGTAPNTNANGEYEADCYSITAGKVFGNTRIDMSGGYVIRNVYGGGNMASVGKGNYSGGPDDYSSAGYGETLSGNLWDGGSQFSQAFLNSGKCTVNITGGTVGYIGHDATDPLKFVYPRDPNTGLPYGNVFGGCRGESAPNILESPRYLYCPEFFLGYVNETDVTIGKSNGTGPTILGSVYGGGMDGHVRRDTKVTINGGTIGSEYTTEECRKVGTSDLNNIMWEHRGNVYGAGSGIGKYKFDLNYDGDFGDVIDYTTPSTPSRTTRLKEEDYSTSAGSVTRFTEVIVNGGTIHRNVYGGGSLASVGGPKIPPISTDPIRRDDQTTATQGKQSLNQVVIAGGQIGDDSSFDAAGNHVYGGYVFGASRGEESIENPSSFAQAVWTDVDIKPHATDPNKPVIYADVYGGGEVGSVRQGVKVDLTGGTVKHDVFGGGKGTSAIAADIGGDVTVDVNNVAEDAKGCVVLGSVYGANNVNGTPLGHVLVYVHGTQNENTTAINDKVDGEYDVVAVFGGGKSADYVPTDTKQTTEVIIEGCDLTSIEEVYGGGYGAAVPATNVLIKGTEIIDNLYGGGYGAGDGNPGANIGYYTNSNPTSTNKVSYLSGSGMAVVQLMAGKVNNVYGGSNTKGDIREGSSVTTVDKTNEAGCCQVLEIQEIYGGGKQAPMEGGAEIVLGCMPDDWIGEIYAGAREANVGNDVSLTITSGKFERVFGGNRSSGKIDGYVEVNIEECPTCGKPGIIIGELYGGGNLAPYEVPTSYGANYQSPRVNVRAFTSIGTIYGGGFGAGAVVTGNPTVNINVGMVQGGGQNFDGIDEKSLDDQTTVKLYPHEAGKIGVIGNVFGGGNAAPVEGSTTVNIGTKEYEVLAGVIPGETDVTGYYVRSGDAPNYVYTLVEPEAPATPGAPVAPVIAQDNTVYCILVKGVDIRGNVYGGGNNAGVTGNTNVVIGKSK